MEGTATTLIKTMGENGKPTEMMPATQINGDNAYLLQRQQGKYVALEFAEAIAKNGYYSEKAKDPTESNIMSQRTYLESNVMSNKKPIAFFFEGVWWENEAKVSGAFYDCVSLKKIKFSDTLRRIGNSALYNCLALKKVDIPSTVTSIGRNAFTGCESVETFDLPDAITEIQDGTFYNCVSLSHIDIPESVEYIDESSIYFLYY